MKNNIRRSISFAAALIMCTAAVSGCGEKKESATKTSTLNFEGYPVNTDETLTWYMPLSQELSQVAATMENTPFAKELEKKTGIKVKYEHPPIGQEEERFNIMLSADKLPDLISYEWYKYAGGPSKAIDDKVIMKLTDVIAKDAPNLKKYLDEHPEINKMVKDDDNDYYCFPFLRGDESLLVSCGPIIRKDWLDELGLDMPETMDDWHTVLKAFKEKKGAAAPLTMQTYILSLGDFVGAYGVKKDFSVENGKVVYGPYDARYKEFLKTFSEWYKEGLIDKDIASVDAKSLDTNFLNSKSGATVYYSGAGIGRWQNAIASKDPEAEFVPVSHPVLNKGETPKFGQKDTWYVSRGAVAVSTSCKNPSLAARLLDYGYSEDGSMLFNFGVEGESYNMKDGYPTYTDKILKNPDGLSMGAALSSYAMAADCGPFIQDKRYIEQYYSNPNQKQALEVWAKSDADKNSLPKITLNSEESKETASLLTSIQTYVDEHTVRFITGAENIDSFDSYLKGLEDLGINKVIEVYQKAYERYMQR